MPIFRKKHTFLSENLRGSKKNTIFAQPFGVFVSGAVENTIKCHRMEHE